MNEEKYEAWKQGTAEWANAGKKLLELLKFFFNNVGN